MTTNTNTNTNTTNATLAGLSEHDFTVLRSRWARGAEWCVAKAGRRWQALGCFMVPGTFSTKRAALDAVDTVMLYEARRRDLDLGSMNLCPGCSGRLKLDQGTMGQYTCTKCGGLVVTSMYLGDSYSLVLPYFHPAPDTVPAERRRYFDLTVLGSEGVQRRHGWYDTETRRIIQVG